jgi:hypothetical protein
VNDKSSNNGVVLLPPFDANISFASSNHSTLYPKLVVTYFGPRKHILLKGFTGKDTYITREAAIGINKNLGKDTQLVLDNGGKESHPLIKFDLAPIPANAKLQYANLVMSVSSYPGGAFKNANGNGTIPLGSVQTSAHKMLVDWKEGTGITGNTTNDGASWRSANESNDTPWTTPQFPTTPPLPAKDGSLATKFINSNVLAAWNDGTLGGNYDVTYDANYPNYVPYNLIQFFSATDGLTLPTPLVDKVTWDVTSIVGEWLTNPTQNFGLMVRADSALALAKFHSFDSVDPQNHPRIEMGYTMPCNSAKSVQVSTQFSTANSFVNQPVTLTTVLTNPNASAMNITSLSNSLPLNMSAALPLAAPICTTGGTAPSLTTSTTNTIKATGGIIAANGGSCTITAQVKASAAGPYYNTIKPNDVVTTLVDAPTNPLFVSSGLLTIRPGLVSIADTYLDNTSGAATTTNYGLGTTIKISNNKSKHGLVAFNLNTLGIPFGTPLTSAVLRLHIAAISNPSAPRVPLVLAVNPITASWTEGPGLDIGYTITPDNVASWKQRIAATNWGNPGGDFDAAVASTVNYTIPIGFAAAPSTPTYIDIPVTAMVQKWSFGTTSNFGFMIRSMTSTSSGFDEIQIVSKNHPQAATYAPQLLVTY